MSRHDLAHGVRIGDRAIAAANPPYVIAEISGNHGGSLAAAIELVEAAKEAGADAVKLQHYTPETITVRSSHPDFTVRGGTLWDGAQLADLYAKAMTPWEWTDDIAAAADRVGITWFSSPFDDSAVDFLRRYDVPAFKIASFEIIDLPLIRYVAAAGKPMIISTGMATSDEIDASIHAATGAGATEIVLLRCNSAYPADPSEMGLVAIPEMARRWQVPIGLSDHTLSATASIAAVALGACAIEKHITHRRSDGGPDADFSLEPDEFADLVHAVRVAHGALGTARFGASERERASIAFRPSLRAIRRIRVGEVFTTENIDSIRPAGGLPPDAASRVIGMCAAAGLDIGDPVTEDVLGVRDRSTDSDI